MGEELSDDMSAAIPEHKSKTEEISGLIVSEKRVWRSG